MPWRRWLNKMRTLSEAKGGPDGAVTRDGVLALLNKEPALEQHPGLAMLVHWLMAGAKTAFIQDANSLIMKTPDLVAALAHLKTTFPHIRRITTYARARTVAQKSAQDLEAIRKAGLDRLHLGLETGDDELLKFIKKGVTSEGQIKGGRKAVAAGFQVSEYWMPGLGGRKNPWTMPGTRPGSSMPSTLIISAPGPSGPFPEPRFTRWSRTERSP